MKSIREDWRWFNEAAEDRAAYLKGLVVPMPPSPPPEDWLRRGLGIGALLLLAGVGLGAALYGYSYATDQRAAMNKLSASIADALNKVTLKADGTVKLADGTVKLDGTGSTVRLDTTGSTVRLDTSGLASEMRPTPQQMQPDARPPSDAKPVTNYTIFKIVKFGQGNVFTNWNFRSSNDPAPWQQYCYYMQGSTDDSHAATKYDIAWDRVLVAPGPNFPVGVDIQQAFNNCVWWPGA